MSERATVEFRLLRGFSELSARPAPDPLPNVSFGGVGAFASVEARVREGAPDWRALLAMPVSPDALEAVDWTTLRVFAIDPESRELRLVESSGFDHASRRAWAEIDAPGLYGAYALPSDPKVREAVAWLRDLHPMILREAALGEDTFRRRICELILCADPSSGGLCERCLGLEIPELGLPEFQLLPLRPVWRPKPSKIPKLPTCQRANGPLAFQWVWGSRDIERMDSPTAPRVTCVSPVGIEYLEPPSWRPDGKRLAYAVNASNAPARLETRDASCGDVKVAYQAPGQIQGIAWNPIQVGGQYEMAFNATPNTAVGHEVHAILEDGTNHRTLVAVNTPVGGGEVIAWVGIPSYSPDGRYLAFLAALRTPPSFGLRGALVVANADGSNPQLVTPPGVSPREPSYWTPDGTAVGSGAYAPGPGYTWLFYPVTNGVPSGGVVSWTHPEIEYLSFSPDGQRICGTLRNANHYDELFVADWDAATRTVSQVVGLRIAAYRPSWGAVCV